jgi:hypothetical protein
MTGLEAARGAGDSNAHERQPDERHDYAGHQRCDDPTRHAYERRQYDGYQSRNQTRTKHHRQGLLTRATRANDRAGERHNGGDKHEAGALYVEQPGANGPHLAGLQESAHAGSQ